MVSYLDQNRKDQVAFVSMQIEKLYGPLFALTQANDIAWAHFRQGYWNDRKEYFQTNVALSPAAIELWRRWMTNVFQPMNVKMEDALVNNAQLLVGWPLPSALVFGVLIAATDPVAVIAMFKDTGIKGRLRLLVESESLLNDGVAAVLFALVLGWAQVIGEAATPMQVALALVLTTGGSILAGLACGRAAIGRTSDHLVETALTMVAAYGSFLVAEHFGLSGVLATVSAGLLMGNLGVLGETEQGVLSSHGRDFVWALCRRSTKTACFGRDQQLPKCRPQAKGHLRGRHNV